VLEQHEETTGPKEIKGYPMQVESYKEQVIRGG
jgi:hypothetical protein